MNIEVFNQKDELFNTYSNVYAIDFDDSNEFAIYDDQSNNLLICLSFKEFYYLEKQPKKDMLMKIVINKTDLPLHSVVPQEFYDAYNITDVEQIFIDRKDPRLIKWLEDYPDPALCIYEIPKGTRYRIIITHSYCEDIEYFDDVEWEIAD